MYIKHSQIFFFKKNSVRKLFRKFPRISEKVLTGNFSEIFPENCGKLFRQTSRKETTKKSPGTFPKKQGDFSSEFALETCVFPTNLVGKFRWFPYGSRQFPGKSPEEFPREFPEIPGGKPRVFFRFFLGFTAATQG